jgi:hypothetical protein
MNDFSLELENLVFNFQFKGQFISHGYEDIFRSEPYADAAVADVNYIV